MDAANVDLKAFTGEFYHKLCFGELEPVLDTLRWLTSETSVWCEVTTLLIPGHNDSEEEIARLSDWFLKNLGPDVPLHFTAFHPDFKMLDVPSWADYDSKLISKGGGIYPRSAKSVTLTPEVKKGLGVDADSLTPTDLIRTLLKAPADLLYNGGIGTYVKATHQTHAEVGDRANDAIRVNGKELCCKVVVEGGNLGFTQLGRIEYALSGGKINTDAIDNSAGVDCSDHEVNIKVLINSVVAEGRMNKEQRNQLLAEMTNEVGALVLRDNYFQTQSLSVRKSMPLDAQTRFIKYLEKAGRLNREIEFLPSDEELASRKAAKTGLTSPERAVLLAYSKITLYDELLASKVPDDPYISTALVRYFPAPLREPYREHMERHPLKREIIATHVTNEMINRAGSTFVHRMQEEVGAGAPDVVRAYLLTREIFDFVSFWQELEALDNKVPHAVQSDMLIDSERLMVRATLWFLRYRNLKDDIAKTVEHFASGVQSPRQGSRQISVSRPERRCEAGSGKPDPKQGFKRSRHAPAKFRSAFLGARYR